MKYSFEDVKIGDSVFFEDDIQSNYDLYWKVIEKDRSSKQLVVQINEMGHFDERWVIKPEQIKYLEKGK